MQERSRSLKPSGHIIVKGTGGQIVLEYVLLLVIGVSVAILITSFMVNRNPDDPGFLIRKWRDIITLVGSDPADDVSQPPD